MWENAWRIFSVTVIFVLTSAKIEPDVRTYHLTLFHSPPKNEENVTKKDRNSR